MKRLLSYLTFGLLVSSCPVAGSACPFCPPSFRNTILQELDATPVAVLAELVVAPHENTVGEVVTGYRVTAVLRGSDSLQIGDTIQLPMRIPSPPGAVHLLLADPDNIERWQPPRGLSPAARMFLNWPTTSWRCRSRTAT